MFHDNRQCSRIQPMLDRVPMKNHHSFPGMFVFFLPYRRCCSLLHASKYNPDGSDFNFALTNVSVSNAEDEADETPVCEINASDENGWNIHANRFGTAVVTLTYNDISSETREYSFNLYVRSDRFVLEPQWPAAGNCMLKNSETKLSFILNHDWRRSDEDQGSEEVQDWTLEFAPDDNGYAYDADLLESVEINGHELTVISREET